MFKICRLSSKSGVIYPDDNMLEMCDYARHILAEIVIERNIEKNNI